MDMNRNHHYTSPLDLFLKAAPCEYSNNLQISMHGRNLREQLTEYCFSREMIPHRPDLTWSEEAT